MSDNLRDAKLHSSLPAFPAGRQTLLGEEQAGHPQDKLRDLTSLQISYRFQHNRDSGQHWAGHPVSSSLSLSRDLASP